MRIEKVNSANCVVVKKSQVNKNSVVPMFHRIEKLTNLGAASFGISFQGKSRLVQLDEDTVAKEKNITDKMRYLGVNTPEIKDNSYELHGNPAEPYTNPITEQHIKNVLNNILIMDKAGIAHGDIEEGHVFYSDDGSIELDCFRFNWPIFNKDSIDWEFPNFCSPTNLKQFEGNSIAAYINKMHSDDEADKFINTYLKEVSKFHAEKASYLEADTKDKINYEKVQAEVLKNPDDDIRNLFKAKVQILYNNRLAFTEWDEGKGECGHEIDDKRMVKGVNIYLDSIYDSTEYIKQIDKALKHSSGIKAEYLNYEKKYAEDIIRKTTKSAVGSAVWTMNTTENKCNTSYRNIPEEVINKFEVKTTEFKKIPPDSTILGDEVLKLKAIYAKVLETHNI